MFRRAVVAVLALAAAVETQAAPPVAVTSCGQRVIERHAKLIRDLNCSNVSIDLAELVLENGGRLTLNGFTLTGQGVTCLRSCTVVGPGTIIAPDFRGSVTVLPPLGRRLTVRGVHIAGRGGLNTGGLSGAYRARVSDCTITGNAFGVSAADRVVVTNSTITGNLVSGVHGLARVVIIDSVVTGNGTASDPLVCPDFEIFCADVLSNQRPVLVGTSTCGTSGRLLSNESWGVCDND